MHLAAYGFFDNKIEKILYYFRPEDIKRGSGLEIESELMIAIRHKNTTLRDWLLENDPDLMYQKSSGSSALHIACMVEDYDAAVRLIKRVTEKEGTESVKKFVNAINTYGCTPLFDALPMSSPGNPGYCTLDNDKMLKFLSIFIEHGVDLGRENAGEYTGKYTLFNQIITSHHIQNLDLASAAVKMLSTGQDITIDLKNSSIREFFTNETNIQKIFASEDYDSAQKSLALAKIKEALTGFDNQDHTIAESRLENAIHLIDQQISQLTEDFTESDVATSPATSGIERVDLDPNTQVEVSGHSHDQEVTEG